MDRVGKTYLRNRGGGMNEMVATVLESKKMSSNTWRHTLLVLVHDSAVSLVGQQIKVDDVPVHPFDGDWKELG